MATPQDDFLTRRQGEAEGAGLTSEGASLSVLTSEAC